MFCLSNFRNYGGVKSDIKEPDEEGSIYGNNATWATIRGATGGTSFLISDADFEKVFNSITPKNITYFGRSFGCEPYGDPVKENIQIVKEMK